MSRSAYRYPDKWHIVNGVVIISSVLLCLLLLPTRFPGMELLGIAPNWLLIWVVVWSVKRSVGQAAIAGLALGLLQDGMTSPDPTHALSLTVVGILTARLQKQRYIQEDFISIALIVFGMTVLAETIAAVQFFFLRSAVVGMESYVEFWQQHQQTALCSAIVSSLWAPVVYYPLNHWWQRRKELEP